MSWLERLTGGFKKTADRLGENLSSLATKAALDAMVRAYAAECATTNVRTNVVAPGPTRTKMYASAYPGIDPMTLPTPEITPF